MRFVDNDRIPVGMETQLPCLRYIIDKEASSEGAQVAIRQLDQLFVRIGCRPVCISEVHGNRVFDSLSFINVWTAREETDCPPIRDGPLVSVIMTTFNVECFVEVSIMSILNQIYRCLELIVVDDCSTDGTLGVLRNLENKDERIRVITKTDNDGTYVSKNIGLKQARGAYVAFQDGDDWSHPERLGKSIAMLEVRKNVVAMTTEWVRMTTEGDLAIQVSGECAYRACISLVMRREEVLSRVGFFDSVRGGADAEYIERLKVVFGDDAVLELPWLLCFGRKHSGSLTGQPGLELVRGVPGSNRMKYRRAYRRWHSGIKSGRDGYMPFPLGRRPFEAPEAMLLGLANDGFPE